jgi:hypothetical protein
MADVRYWAVCCSAPASSTLLAVRHSSAYDMHTCIQVQLIAIMPVLLLNVTNNLGA